MASSPGAPKERPLIERFESAVTVIRSLPKDGSFQPSDMVKLKFYGLYKQAREGPNNTAKPGFWDPTARAKWEAWNLCGNMTKEEAMKMYIRELEQMIETMPQSAEVEQFMKAIGPFYEFVEDEETAKETEKNDTGSTKSIKRVTFDEQSSYQDNKDDSEGELEFEDSYDNLPPTKSTTPLTSSSQAIIERRPTPYISKQGVPLAQMHQHDALSTNLFHSPSSDMSLPTDYSLPHPSSSQSTSSLGVESVTLNGQLSQLLHSVQILTQQFSRFLEESTTRSPLLSWRRVILLAIAPVVINIIFRYWGSHHVEWQAIIPKWMWLVMTTCHIVCNVLIMSTM